MTTLEEKMQLVANILHELAEESLKSSKESKVECMKDYYEGKECAFRLAAKTILSEIK